MTRTTPAAVQRSLRQVGEHLKTWRKLRGLTAAEVAARASLAVTTVQRLENGKGATLENVLRVARARGARGTESATFACAAEFLAHPGAYALDPELPLRIGASHTDAPMRSGSSG